MIGGSIPNQNHRTGICFQPVGQEVQELDRVLLVVGTIFPEQALSPAEVIGSIPVEAIRQRWTVADAPGHSAFIGPSIAELQVSVDMDFVDVNEQNLLATKLGKPGPKLLDEGPTLGWIRLLEDFLTLFPTQTELVQSAAQQIATDLTAKDLLGPTSYLGDGQNVAV